MPKKNSCVIGLIQMACSDNSKANLEKAVQKIRQASKAGARIICLQELFKTPYFPQTEVSRNFSLAEPVPGPGTEFFSKIARDEKVVLVTPFFEKRAQGVYHNTAAVIDADGSFLGKYRKMHIPDDPGFYEKFYFTPGDLGFKTFQTRYARIGVLICWDQWFPEAARLAVLGGAQILFYPTAIGWNVREKSAEARAQREAWEIIQRGHAVANGVYVAAVNRVGLEKRLRFWGSSFVADPFGKVISRAGDKRDEILVTECDFSKIDETRESWPFLRDRRVDAYKALTQRYLGEK